MKTQLFRSFAVGLVAYGSLFGAMTLAESIELLPTPDPISTTPTAPAEVKPTVPLHVPEKTPAPVACKTTRVAEVYKVYQLISQCGDRVPDSGLRGVFNRHHACVSESVLAEVYAAPCTCESCESASKVADIRCKRGSCNVCGNDDYVKALTEDLISPSRRVRKAATRSLRVCGFRVTPPSRTCVEEEVPLIVLY